MMSASGHSFLLLCVPHRGELVNFARRLTSNVDLAEDIVQDAFVQALVAWGDWSPEYMYPAQAARAWLYRIVGNRFANGVRDTRLHRVVLVSRSADVVNGLYGDDVDTVAIASSRRDPEQSRVTTDTVPTDRKHLVARQMVISRRDRDMAKLDDDISGEVLIAVGRLHPKRREVVRRYYFDGETCEAIALAMHITSGCVRSLLMRARAKLGPLLERFAYVNYELGCARVDMHAKPTKCRKADAGSVKGIVRNVHRRTLRHVKVSPDQATARRL